jgi:adenylate cyclase
VVAGHFGAETRFAYTVVAEPVEEARRLTELAKQHDERLLACAATPSMPPMPPGARPSGGRSRTR